MNKKFFDTFFYVALFFLALGILLFCLPSETVMIICYRFICIIITIMGIVKLVFLDKSALSEEDYYLDLIEGIISILIGVICFNFSKYYFINIFFGVIYLIIPIIRIAIATNKINQFFMDIFKFIFASVIFVSTYHAPLVAKIYTALIFTLMGLGIIGIKIILYLKKKDKGGLF